MIPFLSGGDFLITSRFYRKLAVGDLIVFDHSIYGRLIKRIKEINKSGEFNVTGENELSLTSDQIGWISPSSVEAKVLMSVGKNLK